MEQIWLKNYPKEVPATIDADQYASLVDLLERAKMEFASRTAYISMGDIRTYAEIEQRSRYFAGYLQSIGLKKGDRIALMLPNILQHPIALFGILRAGMTVVNVNPLYTPREMSHQLIDSGAVAIVALDAFSKTLKEALEIAPIKHIILTSVGDQLSFIKRRFVNFVIKYIKKGVPKISFVNAIKFNSAIKQGALFDYQRPEIKPDDIAFLQYTGGTTGVSKGAMLTHRNMLANLAQAKAVFGPVFNEQVQTIVTALPLYHVFALTVNCMLMIDNGGTSLLIANPRDMKTTLKEMARTPFTVITGVNTLFSGFLRQEAFHQLNFSKLRICVGGGMPVHKNVANDWLKATGCHLLEGYGLTECSPLVAVNPYNITHYTGSIGLPVPSTDVRLVDDNHQDVPLGSAGELWVRGPQVMKGYWNNHSATHDIMEGDWLKTGDIATMDDMGFIRIVDRKKEMILVSGFNVYPSEIEDIVMQHPKVLEAAAIGLPNEQTGELIHVCVVKKDNSLTEEEIIAFCKQNLTGYKIPRKVTFHEDLPKSNVGKILRRELKTQFLAK
ncbi:AMP-binding protein [Thorsellia kenyensis]|uniref:Long-chain-fatty-acid--CoA ligase n=1 Tax=Thorsellia kenyensis TaxID=1549888 RepID=A0ABV6C8B9_9GAMM